MRYTHGRRRSLTRRGQSVIESVTLMNAYLMPLTGGVLLGLSAMWLLLSLGRFAGISGIAWGSLAGPERAWRWLF